jgi:hypothetical protein
MCSSKYAKRLYMLACQWRKAGKVGSITTVDDLKILLDLKDPKGKKKEQYIKWSAFNKYVLETAKRQINEHTDILIDFRISKLGKAYHWLDILVNNIASNQLQIKFDQPIETQKSVKSILHHGFSMEQSVAIAKLGIKEFNKYKTKANAKIIANKMSIDGFIPYIVKVYQNKGVLIIDTSQRELKQTSILDKEQQEANN